MSLSLDATQSMAGMKKLTVILFWLIYLNTALGVGVDIHLCGGIVADISIVGLRHAHCCCPPGAMPPGCCKNVVCFCKTDNHRLLAFTNVGNLRTTVQAPMLFPDFISPLSHPIYEEYRSTGSPPGILYKHPVDLCIMHKVFRI